MSIQNKSDLFVTCSQGLEILLQQELNELGYDKITPSYRGVYVSDSSMQAIYRINYCSRIATRVLQPLYRFRCRDKHSLYRGISDIDWLRYIPRNKTFAIDANVDHRELRNSLFAAQVAKDAICDQFRDKTDSRPSVNVQTPDVQLNLFVYKDLAVMSIDTSGTPLFKRGYRQESVEAPMRESLAAALLRLAKYTAEDIFYDPCCGSGTLLIEAALIATKTQPGFLRHNWGFMQHPEFTQENWLKVKTEADQFRIPLQKGRLFGTDINKHAVQTSKVNLRAVGFHNDVTIEQRDFRDHTPLIAPNFLMVNPPHGKRLDEVEQLRPLYRAIGDFMKRQMVKPARGFVFTGDLELAKEVGLAPKQRHVVDNSGVDSRLLEFDIY